ncbi:MAG: amidohydrolase family protein [Flavobacteriales bacterium]
MGLRPEESINAATLNGAALELSDQLGSVTKGKLANLIVTEEIRKPLKGFRTILESRLLQRIYQRKSLAHKKAPVNGALIL